MKPDWGTVLKIQLAENVVNVLYFKLERLRIV